MINIFSHKGATFDENNSRVFGYLSKKIQGIVYAQSLHRVTYLAFYQQRHVFGKIGRGSRSNKKDGDDQHVKWKEYSHNLTQAHLKPSRCSEYDETYLVAHYEYPS